MATPADQRLLELLEKWLKSLELHTKYSGLDDDAYWQVQPWTPHQRPSRWILDLATQKTAALKAQVQERIDMRDAGFSDSLELMIFLANLVGSEHIERFIPVADAGTERTSAPPSAPRQAPAAPAAPAAGPADSSTGTREMPQFAGGRHPPSAPPASRDVARTERRAAAKAPLDTAAKPKHQPSPAAREQVIADAVRLVQWGRKWYELAELISRMSDRPPLTEVRRILKDNKETIDAQVGKD